MNRKAAFAILLAIFLPLLGYFLVSYYSSRDVSMPARYFYDSVIVVNKNGKISYDTSWHQVQNINLTNQLGQQVSLNDLNGKILVIDFFFTRCPTLCPQLGRAMKKLQSSFPDNDSIVQFISISVDPAHDSVSQLKNWAQKFNVNPDNWWLLTGNKDSIYRFAFQELKASVADVNVDTAFLHTDSFFLLDKHRIVRGWYTGTDTTSQKKLVRDIPLLMLEKNKKRTFKEFLKGLLQNA